MAELAIFIRQSVLIVKRTEVEHSKSSNTMPSTSDVLKSDSYAATGSSVQRLSILDDDYEEDGVFDELDCDKEAKATVTAEETKRFHRCLIIVHVSCCIAAAISLALGLYQVIYTLATRDNGDDIGLINTIIQVSSTFERWFKYN